MRVIAEVGNLDDMAQRGVDEPLAFARFDGSIVDLDLHPVHASRRPSCCERPCSMKYSNSPRNFLRKLKTGIAAASPSAHSVLPEIPAGMFCRFSRSARTPLPAPIRSTISFIQPVPSRQGVHCPQDS